MGHDWFSWEVEVVCSLSKWTMLTTGLYEELQGHCLQGHIQGSTWLLGSCQCQWWYRCTLCEVVSPVVSFTVGLVTNKTTSLPVVMGDNEADRQDDEFSKS